MNRHVLLSFDVEEFDLPLEYNHVIDLQEQMNIGKQGLERLMPLIDSQAITCTMFTTANFAHQFPAQIKQLAQKHEIASHTFYHSSFENKDLLASKLLLEEIAGKPVTGLRMPRMRGVEMSAVKNAGYIYDSSINPVFLPGRYNNLHLPRTVYKEEGVFRVPASASPHLRLPLFWMAFKNYPYSFFLYLCRQCIKKDGYLCLYFHPWEFIDINAYKLPWHIKRYSGEQMLKKLNLLINDLKKDCDFITMQDFIEINKAE